MVRLILTLMVTLVLACGASQAARLDLDTVNQAQFSDGEPKGVDPMLLKAQILLDRARFSPGLIDGRLSDNFAKAVSAFQAANGLPSDGKLTRETWDKLTAGSTEPVLVTYEVTAKDVRGPFTRRIPTRLERMARLKRLGYRNARERLAERFHVSEQLLRMLNPRAGFRKADASLV
ncbi:peptidoglycan-binding domain-containing protein, partial [Mesorhizobium sp.]